jgi:hypothetical protein
VLAAYQELAVAFASALVEGDFARAKEMLGPPLSETTSAADLQVRFDQMYLGYAEDDRPKQISFDPQFSGEEWPAKQEGDVGWAYVAVLGDECVEAVTLTIAKAGEKLLIRDVEWGRP